MVGGVGLIAVTIGVVAGACEPESLAAFELFAGRYRIVRTLGAARTPVTRRTLGLATTFRHGMLRYRSTGPTDPFQDRNWQFQTPFVADSMDYGRCKEYSETGDIRVAAECNRCDRSGLVSTFMSNVGQP